MPVVGEKAYMCEMVEQHTRLFGPCTCAVEMIQKKATRHGVGRTRDLDGVVDFGGEIGRGIVGRADSVQAGR